MGVGLTGLLGLLVSCGPGTAGSIAPGAPTEVSASRGNAQATVSWAAPASNGGSEISGYTVTSTPGGFTATTTGPRIATVTGLSTGASYTFTVVATNGVGTGPVSAPSNPVVPATVPDPPTGVEAAEGSGEATVSWTVPVSNGGSAITGYTVTSSDEAIPAVTTTGALEATVPGLSNGTRYTFTVTATNAVGPGPASAASNPVLLGSVPGAPTAVVATAGDGEATVSWQAPASNGTDLVTGYTVTSSPGDLTATTTGALTATVTGLLNGTSFTFTVTATNVVGAGPASDLSNAVMPAPTTDGGVLTVILAWSPPAHSYGQVPVGTTSAAQTFTLTNSGTATATGCSEAVLTGADPAQFVRSNDTCGVDELPPDTACTVDVAVSPVAAGAVSATLERTCTTGGTTATTVEGLTAAGVP